MSNKEEVKKELIEVRKSYRLLFLYQKRILELVKFIGEYYDCEYKGGWPLFSSSAPNKGQGKLENWSWDWLNMYYYHFYFEKKIGEKKVLQFAIFHQADTGYFDLQEEVKLYDQKKLKFENFSECEVSGSKLIFALGNNIWDTSEKRPWENLAILNGSNFLNENEEDVIGDEEISRKLILKRFNVSDFWDEDSTVEQLSAFTKLCSENDIIFRKKEYLDTDKT